MKIKNLSILKIYKRLSQTRKRQLLITLIVMISSGITELLVINSVAPFIAAITNPKLLFKLPITKIFIKLFATGSNNLEIYPFVILFALSIILSSFLRILTLWTIAKVTSLFGNDISVKTFSNNICQPYEYHLKNSSSNLITQNTVFVTNSINAFRGFLFLIYSIFITLTLTIGLIIISPFLTILSITIFAFIYLFLGKIFKKIIIASSKKRSLSEQLKIRTLSESLGSIRNLILESNHHLYINKFRIHDLNARTITAKNDLISSSPKFFIEGLALLFIIGASLFFMKNVNNDSSIIISLGAFTLGMQKLLPAFQSIYTVNNDLKFYSNDLEQTIKFLEIKVDNKTSKKTNPLKFKESIKFDSIYFSYDREKYVISNLNLEILKGQKIGIIGKTGSGKTTISDLFMGLLKPTSGKIYVDGKDIYDQKYPSRIKNWRRSISHVPQDIFLSDTTIAENIAFGIDKNLISFKKLKECSKKAQIHEFIVSLKDAYLTEVGERGVRLSGGQLQRIAIARALYRNSKILVFDEATSALDKNTEIDLMKSINSLSNELTIISIAHNHSTLKNYDRIIKVEKGTIVEIGKDELLI